MVPYLKLVAIHTGDGWQLEVQDENGALIGCVEWPFGDEEKTTSELEACGWEVE